MGVFVIKDFIYRCGAQCGIRDLSNQHKRQVDGGTLVGNGSYHKDSREKKLP